MGSFSPPTLNSLESQDTAGFPRWVLSTLRWGQEEAPEAPAGRRDFCEEAGSSVLGDRCLMGSPPLCPGFAVFLQLCGGREQGRLSLTLLHRVSREVVQIRLSSLCPRDGGGKAQTLVSGVSSSRPTVIWAGRYEWSLGHM